MILTVLVQITLFIFPWSIRRIILNKIFNFQISKSASIKYSIILAKRLIMKDDSIINSFTFCNNIDLLELEQNSRIGTFNYITGFSTSSNKHFSHVKDRACKLKIGKHSAITTRHYLDCTGCIMIGEFSTFAGLKSQILTHSIDINNNRQDAKIVVIGDYCFVGTNCVILPGAVLPDFSVLGASSMLNKEYAEKWMLYGGNPAKPIKNLSNKCEYFNRIKGFVY